MPCHCVFLVVKLAIFVSKAHNNKFRAEVLLVLLAIGNKIFILLGDHVVVGQKFLLFSLLVIVNVGADVETAEEHLKTRHWINVLIWYFTLSFEFQQKNFNVSWVSARFVLTKKDTMYPHSVYCIHSGNSQSMRSPLKPKTRAPANWICRKEDKEKTIP